MGVQRLGLRPGTVRPNAIAHDRKVPTPELTTVFDQTAAVTFGAAVAVAIDVHVEAVSSPCARLRAPCP